jgi:UDP-GlcNAc:undecaprenyl-phosphate GlcNAc-1-phosphate transferase
MTLTVIAVASGTSALLVPLVKRLAEVTDFMDRPLGEHHKKHAKATPLMGGLAMAAAWLTIVWGGVLAISMGKAPEWVLTASTSMEKTLPLLGVITGGALGLMFIGLADDKKPMGPFVKFGLQIVICVIVALYPGVRITLLWTIPWVTIGITVLWMLFIINAFNFFDNMDGLAAGVGAIAASLFAVIAAFRGQVFVGGLAAATAGVAIGFYLYNKNPASIFMGDAGSHFLGFLLAVLATLTIVYDPESSQSTAALLIPAFILALPIFDTFAVCIIRIRLGKPIYYGDHNHISHRFVKMGLTRKTAVFIIHLLALSLGLSAITLLWLDTTGAIVVLVQATAMLALISVLHTHEQGPKE